MADVTLGSGATALYEYLENGKTTGTTNAVTNGKEAFEALMKGLAGDFVIVCDPETATPEPTDAAWSQTVTVTLETYDGELHSWYNGPITLAVEDAGGGTASILPVAGEQMMTNGTLSVVLSGDANTWANGETATLTVSDPATAGTGFNGWVASDATCVITFTTAS